VAQRFDVFMELAQTQLQHVAHDGPRAGAWQISQAQQRAGRFGWRGFNGLCIFCTLECWVAHDDPWCI
jgi:hypothetical protein